MKDEIVTVIGSHIISVYIPSGYIEKTETVSVLVDHKDADGKMRRISCTHASIRPEEIRPRNRGWFQIIGDLLFSQNDPLRSLEEEIERARRWCEEKENASLSIEERINNLRLREAAIKELEQSGQLSLPEN